MSNKNKKPLWQVTWNENVSQKWQTTLRAYTEAEAISSVKEWNEEMQENIELVSSQALEELINVKACQIKEDDIGVKYEDNTETN